jgi:CheY-like chemotaxis protein
MAAQTLLVVEDDDMTREGLTVVFGQAGYNVAAAANGRQALDFLQSHPASALILLDMMMPGLDGWHFLRRRDKDTVLAAIPVLVMTALGVASPEWAAGLGGWGVLRKALDMGSVVDQVREYLS